MVGAEAGLGLVLLWAGGPLLPDGARTAGAEPTNGADRTLDQLVVPAAAGLAWLAFALVVASTAATILLATVRTPASPAPPALSRLCGPIWWRRAVLGACGLSLVAPVAAIAAPAGDGPGGPCRGCAVEPASRSKLSGLQFPDLPDVASAHPGAAGTRTVRPGDSLWQIARDSLAPAASDAAVCHRVDALYSANRAVIGPDPDLIFPGTELTQPGGIA
jgi:nucleoid-associated protein YgaU